MRSSDAADGLVQSVGHDDCNGQQYRGPRLPGSDRTWLAAGGRIQLDERWTLDVGFAHLWLKDASSELPATGPVPGALLGTYTSNTNIVGVQTSVRF